MNEIVQYLVSIAIAVIIILTGIVIIVTKVSKAVGRINNPFYTVAITIGIIGILSGLVVIILFFLIK